MTVNNVSIGMERPTKTDVMFVNPEKGDFSVKENSYAFKLGFKNFPMYNFGVQKPELKAIAKKPDIPVCPSK